MTLSLKNIRTKPEALKEFAWIATKFIIFFALGIVFLEYLLDSGWMLKIGESIAEQTWMLAKLLGFNYGLDGLNVVCATRTLVIVVECTGIFIMIVYAALVLAYPFSWTFKIPSLIAGLIIIYFANLLRLVMTAVVADMLSDRVFLFAHNFVFQTLMVVVLLMIWGVLLSLDKKGSVSLEIFSYLGLVFLALFIFEAIFIWLSRVYPSIFAIDQYAYIAPALAVVVAARGIKPLPKFALSLSGLAVFFTADRIYNYYSHRLYAGQLQNPELATRILEVAYAFIIVAIPILLIIIAAGKNPSHLWVRKS